MMLSDILIPALQEAFPSRGLRVASPPDPIATFPAACEQVGDLLILDHHQEATVVIGNITHFHVNPYDQDLSDEQRFRWITEGIVEFLDALFADEVLVWCYSGGQGTGGWRYLDGTIPNGAPVGVECFVWSDRLAMRG
jgi:hypothetical protein